MNIVFHGSDTVCVNLLHIGKAQTPCRCCFMIGCSSLGSSRNICPRCRAGHTSCCLQTYPQRPCCYYTSSVWMCVCGMFIFDDMMWYYCCLTITKAIYQSMRNRRNRK